MITFVLRRLLLFVPTLWAIATLTFFMMRLAPGGPFQSEKDIPKSALAQLQRQYGLDRPLGVQYLNFLRNAAHLDFGPSYKFPTRSVREIILERKRAGCTVFFSTHILSDAEALCDRVALLRGGELLRVGGLADILGSDVSHMEILVAGLGPEAVERLAPALRASHALGERWRLEAGEASVPAIVQGVEQAGGRILSVQPVRQSLEDYFIREMGAQTEAEWELEG